MRSLCWLWLCGGFSRLDLLICGLGVLVTGCGNIGLVWDYWWGISFPWVLLGVSTTWCFCFAAFLGGCCVELLMLGVCF